MSVSIFASKPPVQDSAVVTVFWSRSVRRSSWRDDVRKVWSSGRR